jgi:ribonuclease J
VHTELARKLKYLEDTSEILKDISLYNKFPKDKVVLLCTGSQGEEHSSIVKLSKDRHPFARVEKDDTVIFSSSTIPGNEREILNTVNSFIEKRAKVFTDDKSLVHTTGHACAEEIKDFINIVKPKYFIPIHGEPIHLKANIDLAKLCKVENSYLLKKDKFIVFKTNKVVFEATESIDRLFVDRSTRLLLDKNIIKERKKIASNGLIIINLIIKNKNIIKVDISSYGVVKSSTLDKIFKNIVLKINKNYKYSLEKTKLKERISNLAKQEFRYFFKDKPEVFTNFIKA